MYSDQFESHWVGNLDLKIQLRFVFKLSNRAIARNVGVGRSSVSRILGHTTVMNLIWPLPEEMTDAELEAILYSPRPAVCVDVAACVQLG